MTQPLLLNLTVIELPVQQPAKRLFAVRLSSAIGLASDTDPPGWPWTGSPTWLAPWNWTLPTGVTVGHDWIVMLKPPGGAWTDISAHTNVLPTDAVPPGLAGVLESLYITAPDAVLGWVMDTAGAAWPVGEHPSSHGSGRSLRTALESLATQPGAIARPLKLVTLIQVDRTAAPDDAQLIAAPNFVMTVPPGKTLSFAPAAVVHDLAGTKPRTTWEYAVAGTGLAMGDVAPTAYAFGAPATLATNDPLRQWIKLTDTGGGHFTQDWESQISDRFAAALDVPALLAGSRAALPASSYGGWFTAASDAWSGVGIDIGPVDTSLSANDQAAAIASVVPAAMPLLRLMASNHGRVGEGATRPDPTSLDLSWTITSDRAETLLAGLGAWFATKPALSPPPQTTSELDTATRLAANWAQALRWVTTTPIPTTGAQGPSFWTALKQDRSVARGLIDLTTGGRGPSAGVSGAAAATEAPAWLLIVDLQLVPPGAPAGTLGAVTLNLCRVGDPTAPLGIASINAAGRAIWTPAGGVASAPTALVNGACRLALRLAWDLLSTSSPPAAYGYAVSLVTPGTSFAAMPPTAPIPPLTTGALPALGRGHYIQFTTNAGQPTVTLVRAATTAVQVAGQFPTDPATLAGMQPRKQLARVATGAAFRAAQVAVAAAAVRPTADSWTAACSNEFDLALANLALANPPPTPTQTAALKAALLSAQSSAARGAFAPMRASNDPRTPAIDVTADAPPILFSIAPPPQGQMIGIGVLAKRGTGQWRSLNRAIAWWDAALHSLALDGAPLRGLTAGGGSASLIRYDGRPFIVTSPPNRPGAQPPTGLVLSRPQAPPLPSAPPVPMPRFGQSMDFAAYLIGPGGVLPPSMRTMDSRPWEWDSASGPPTSDPFIIEVPYARTTPLAAPRLAGGACNASPITAPDGGFDALAGEVRNHPVEWTITNGAPVEFYRSRDRCNGVVDLKATATGNSAWSEIDIDLLDLQGLTGDRTLLVELVPLDAAANGAPPPTASVTVAATGFDPLDLRLTLRANSPANPAAPAIRRVNVDSLQYPETSVDITVNASAIGATTAGLYEVRITLNSADANASITLEPPAVTVDGRAVPCPEASAPKPALVVLSTAQTSQSLQLRPPAVSQRAWTRWAAVDNPLSGGASWVQQVNQALAADPPDTSLDDPAVGGFFFELIGRFPDSTAQITIAPVFWPVDAPAPNASALAKAQAIPKPVTVNRVDTGAARVAPSTDGKTMIVSVPKGQIWELRISAAALWSVATERFAKELMKGVRAADGAVLGQSKHWLLGAPLSFLVETATDETPQPGDYLLSVSATPGPSLKAVLAAPTIPNVSQTAADEARRRLRYIGTVAPQVQRWTWSGKPLSPPRDADLTDWELLAYEGRDDDDALALPAVRLHRAHLAGAAPLIAQPAPQPHGVGHWRVRVALQSRYAILGETAPSSQTLWADGGASTLTPSPIQATKPSSPPPPLVRPSIDLALPLTSALAAADPTATPDPSLPPPLMLILNQAVFPDGDVSDRIEIGLEAARHPDPDWTLTSPPPPQPLPPTSKPRAWPQVAPDPRLLGTGHDGSPVTMRLLGPVGWTLDKDVMRPSYPRASLLLAFLQPPAGQQAWDAGGSWPMLKIRARRFQEPDVNIGFADPPEQPPMALTSSLPSTDPGAGFCLEFKGEISQTAPPADLVLQPSPASSPSHAWRLRVSRVDESNIQVSATLELVSGTVNDISRIRGLKLPSPAHDIVRLRVIVGKRDAVPGVDGKTPPPAWDISAAILRGQDLRQDQTDGSSGWIVLPIFTLSGIQVAQADWDGGLVVQGASSNWSWRYLRISACTDGVWVQFGADAASLRLVGDRCIVLSTSQFVCAQAADGSLSLTLPDPRDSDWVERSTSQVELQPRTITGSQVSAPASLYGVVSAEVFDAAGQPSELPLGVFRIAPSNVTSGKATADWSVLTGAVDLSLLKSRGGRLRFLSVEEQPPFSWDQPDPNLPFLPVTRLFDRTLVAGTVSPADGVGRIIAISPPIDIGS